MARLEASAEQGKFAPEKKAAVMAGIGGVIGFVTAEALRTAPVSILKIGALNAFALGALGFGFYTWYQARFKNRRSP